MPNEINSSGRIVEVCANGFTSSDFVQFYTDEQGFNADTIVRPFIYVILYRPLDTTDPNEYQMVGQPAIVYNLFAPGCISQVDGLDMEVQNGDRIGAFIPNNCSRVAELLTMPYFVPLELRSDQIEMLCPSQINLAVIASVSGDDVCTNGFHVDISRNELSKIRREQFVNISVRLNIKITIDVDSEFIN